MKSDLNSCGNSGIWLTDVTHGSKSHCSRASSMLQMAKIPSHWSWVLEHGVTPTCTTWSPVAAMRCQERLCKTEKSLIILFLCPSVDSTPAERGTEAGRLWNVVSISSIWGSLRPWEPTRKPKPWPQQKLVWQLLPLFDILIALPPAGGVFSYLLVHPGISRCNYYGQLFLSFFFFFNSTYCLTHKKKRKRKIVNMLVTLFSTVFSESASIPTHSVSVCCPWSACSASVVFTFFPKIYCSKRLTDTTLAKMIFIIIIIR